MTPAAQVSAAIEILQKIDETRRPAPDALKEWGVSHRFAGSKDRAAIASLVYDALRKRASAAYVMGEETPRAVMLGALREARGYDVDAISALFSGEGHASPPLTAQERERLETASLSARPAHVRGDFPQWLEARLEAALGEAAAEEGAALSARAPVDLRVNIPNARARRRWPSWSICIRRRRRCRRWACASCLEPMGEAPRSRRNQPL